MEEKTSIWKVALNYGTISGLSLVILSALWYVTNLSFNQYVGWLNYVVIIGLVIIGTKKQRELDDGFITYGKALAVGSVISIVAALLLAIFTYILYTIIDVDLINKLYAMQEQAMMTNPAITEEQIDTAMEFAKKFTNSTTVSLGAFFGVGFIGFIISLITSAVLKKNKEF